MNSLLSSTVGRMREDACHGRYQSTYDAARSRRAELAAYADLRSVLSAMRGTELPREAREALALALLCEYQAGSSKAWTHALFAAFYPMLCRLRARVVCSWSAADVEQVVLAAFFEALDEVQPEGELPCSFHLRRTTARIVFRRLRRERQGQLDVVDEDVSEIAEDRMPEDCDTEAILRGAGDSAELLRATVCGDETLREFVQRTVPGNDEARRRAYRRLRSRRSRALERLKSTARFKVGLAL
jgi:hypothetical protein